MKTNQWNRRFLQSMLLGLLLMFFGLFVVDSRDAEPKLSMGISTYSDFKEIVPDQSEGDFGQKLKDLTEKKRLAARIPVTGERPWTSSSIFRSATMSCCCWSATALLSQRLAASHRSKHRTRNYRNAHSW